jgi:hypothetical protein
MSCMGAAARVAPMSVGLGREEVVGRRRRGGAGACMLDVSDDLRRAAHCHTPDQGRWGDQTEVLPAAWLRGVCLGVIPCRQNADWVLGVRLRRTQLAALAPS